MALASKVRVRTKEVTDLTDAEIEECNHLTLDGFGGSGSMRPMLADCLRGERDGFASLIRVNGKLVAWALTFSTTRWSPQGDHKLWHSYFFTHPDHRRDGHGRHLYRHVRRRFGIVKVYPWSDGGISQPFFVNIGAIEESDPLPRSAPSAYY